MRSLWVEAWASIENYLVVVAKRRERDHTLLRYVFFTAWQPFYLKPKPGKPSEGHKCKENKIERRRQIPETFFLNGKDQEKGTTLSSRKGGMGRTTPQLHQCNSEDDTYFPRKTEMRYNLECMRNK